MAVCNFIRSDGDALWVFQLVEPVLDSVPKTIDVLINCTLHFAAAAHRADGDAASLFHIFANPVGVVAFVGDPHFRFWSVGVHHEVVALVVRDFPAGDFRRDRKPFAIGAEINFCRKAAL